MKLKLSKVVVHRLFYTDISTFQALSLSPSGFPTSNIPEAQKKKTVSTAGHGQEESHMREKSQDSVWG